MCKREIQVEKVNDPDEWDRYLSDFSASPFLSRSWLEPFGNLMLIPVCYRFILDGEVIGFTAGLVQNSRLAPARLLNLFRSLLFYSGPSVRDRDPKLISDCIGAMFSAARRWNISAVRYRSWDYPCRIQQDDIFPKPESQRIEYLFDLSNRELDPEINMNRNQKRKVKLAEKKGLSFREVSSKKKLEEILPIMMETKEIRMNKGRKEYDPYYIPYLNNDHLAKHIENGIARIFLSEMNGRTMSAIVILASEDRAYGLIAGSTEAGYDIGASPFTILNLLRTMQSEGYDIFNFGGLPRGDDGVQLSRFKEAMGAKKYRCIGGYADRLGGPIQRKIIDIYRKLKG